MLGGNIFVKLVHLSRSGNHRQICRFAFHTSFLSKLANEQRLKQLGDYDASDIYLHCSLDQFLIEPNSIAKDSAYTDFKIKIVFTEACTDPSCTSKIENSKPGTVLEETGQILKKNAPKSSSPKERKPSHK